MDLNPSTCWDCPVSFYESLGCGALALALLWIGLAMRRWRHWAPRWLGGPILAASLLVELADIESIRRFTIHWPWMRPSLDPPNDNLDALLIALLVTTSVHLIVRAPPRSSQ